MDPATEKRQHGLYLVVWFALAWVVGCYVLAVAVIGLPSHVVIPILVAVPALALLAYYFLHRKGFRINGQFAMDDGQTVTRSVTTVLPSHANDERFVAELAIVLEDLRTRGYRFTDGHGRLIALLNEPAPSHRRLIVQGAFLLPDGSTTTRTVSCPLRTAINRDNTTGVRNEMMQALQRDGYRFPEGTGILQHVHCAIFV